MSIAFETSEAVMTELKYSLVIEVTDDSNFFGFYSPELDGFTGVGHSIEDCVYKARWSMEEDLTVLNEEELPIPLQTGNPKITITNSGRIAPTA